MKRSIIEIIIGKDTNVETKDAWIAKCLNALPAGSRILDVGAGEGRWKTSCKHLDYVSQDFCQYDARKNTIGLSDSKYEYHEIDIVSDITNIPVDDGSFDAVLCTEVLEHVPDPNKAIQELVRVCKNGGRLILTAPFCSLTHMAPYHFCTGFNRFFYENVLKLYGAEIIECKSNGDYFGYLRQELLRLPSVVNKYTKKPTVLLRFLIYSICYLLKKQIECENRSGELLCFGFFVEARKTR